MKGTETFKEIIQSYLIDLASKDELFAKTLQKSKKNIDDCITYILNQVKASGCNGFADGEIFQMAVHYYDEDDIQVGKAIGCKVVVNHADFEGKKVSAQRAQPGEEVKSIEKKTKVVKLEPSNQVSLFDFPDV